MADDTNRAAAPAAAHDLTDALVAWERPLLHRLDAGDAEAGPGIVVFDAAIFS